MHKIQVLLLLLTCLFSCKQEHLNKSRSIHAIPLDAATAGALNAAFADYNNGVLQVAGLGLITAEEAASRQVSFVEGQNAALILDEDLTDLTGVNPALTNMRQATSDDLLVLTSSGFLGTPADPNNPLLINGVSVPLADNWVLTSTEVDYSTV